MTVRLMTLRDVAERLTVHPSTVKRLPIPFTRIGQQRRYHPKVVEKYEADHSNRPAAWREGTAA